MVKSKNLTRVRSVLSLAILKSLLKFTHRKLSFIIKQKAFSDVTIYWETKSGRSSEHVLTQFNHFGQALAACCAISGHADCILTFPLVCRTISCIYFLIVSFWKIITSILNFLSFRIENNTNESVRERENLETTIMGFFRSRTITFPMV